MNVGFVLTVTFVSTLVGCGGANLRNLPIASAIIVHSCAAAEADAYIRGEGDDGKVRGGAYAVSEVTLTLKVSGEGKVTGSIKDYLGLEGVRGAEKSAELKLSRLPTMGQCKKWGYWPQLGEKGCLYGTERCKSTDTLPADVPVPPKSGSKKDETPES
jgi:hypothetical protein